MEDNSQVLQLQVMETEPISRPSSTSTQNSAAQNLPHMLPSIAAAAAAAAAAASQQPQPRPVAIAPAVYPSGTSPASTHPGGHGGPGATLTVCQNCETSTTPLWRRDEMGAVLCNACGLFLKLHGRPRPISLKTDVIKSRNRVKTARPDMRHKKQNPGLAAADPNGDYAQNGMAAANARRASQRSANGNPDGTDSPVSRTATPNMYSAHPMYQTAEEQFQAQQLTNFGVTGASPGRVPSPMNGERLDLPQTQEQLIQANSTLKTRVSELEVIQELYRGRIQQLEQEENLRLQEAAPNSELLARLAALTEELAQKQKDMEDGHRRENMLKRRLDELELELKKANESRGTHENGRAKRPRLDDESASSIDGALEEKPNLP